jgi:tetratricopeptide (TPR) repeat protein
MNFVTERNLISVVLRLLQEGDLGTAAELYETRGHAVADNLLAKIQANEAVAASGAKMFEQARDYARAAKLHEHARQFAEGARLWEEAGDSQSAARCWKLAGNRGRAAIALQASGSGEEAALIYGDLQQPGRQAAALASESRWLEAAAAYREAGNSRAELDALRAVPLDAPERIPAVKRMAQLLAAKNRSQEAAQILAEALRENEHGRLDIDLHEILAAIFDGLNQAQHADRLRLRAARLRAREAAPSAELQSPDAVDTQETPPADPDFRFLKQVPIFARLSLEDMRDLFRLMTEESWRPGQAIIDAGAEAPGLVVLLEGDAEVYAVIRGGQRHLNSVGAGAHLGEISMLTHSRTTARVTASTMCRGLRLTREAFEEFLDTHAMAALRIYRLFSEQLAERVRALSAP